jgi:hypothetical protein
VLADRALAQAKKADGEVKRKKSRGPLHGVPVAIKDLCDIEGVPTAGGIPMFRNNIAGRTSTVAARLEAAGAVIVGKLQLGFVTLSGLVAMRREENGGSGSDARRCTPCVKGFRTELALRCGSDEMAADVERVVDSGMHGQELLSGSG